MTTDHELNVQARKLNERAVMALGIGSYSLVGDVALLVRLPGKEHSQRFSPATSIEDAMGLLELLTNSQWRSLLIGLCGVEAYGVKSVRDLPQAITEVFAATKKAEASG